MIMVAMSYFCRQNVSQISLEIVANGSHPSELLALLTCILFGVISVIKNGSAFTEDNLVKYIL